MAYIRVREMNARTKGRPVRSYVVSWREPVRDEYGAVVPGKTVQRTETFKVEKQAKARLRSIESALDSARPDPSAQRTKANTPLGTYAQQYLSGLVGAVDPTTIEGYEKLYRTHIGPVFGSRPVASITTADVTAFRAQLLAPHKRHQGKKTVTRSPKTVKHIVGTLKRILDTAQDDQAIPSNPVIPNRRRTTKRHNADGKQPFRHRPLTANQVASVCDWIARNGSQGRGNAVYALAVLFAAHTGVRASELQGLQVQDVTLSDIPGTVGAIRVVRTAQRKGRKWIYGTPKSEASSDRVVPLAPWLADDLRAYLAGEHPFAGKLRDAEGKMHHIGHAPLFPGRINRYTFDWANPVHAGNLYENYLAPATEALGFGSVRFHDLRHTFATMNLSAGEHYMQVSKWLGHSTFVLTLSTYADYINEDEQAAPKVGRGTASVATDNVVDLERRRSDTA